MFKFKTPSKKARETMSKVASGEIDGTNFEESCIEKIKKLTDDALKKFTFVHKKVEMRVFNVVFFVIAKIESQPEVQ